MFFEISVVQRDSGNHESGEDQVVEALVDVIEESLIGEVGGKGEVELADAEEDALVEEKENESGVPIVGLSPEVQDQLGEVSERRDRKIRGTHCLFPLFPNDSHAHICFLYHVDIIGPIPNSEDLHLPLLKQPHYLDLLLRVCPAEHDALELHQIVEEIIFLFWTLNCLQ